jgi:hypothetical protein
MTFKLYNPTTKKSIWRSLSASALQVDPKDGRSCKTNEFEIKHTGTAATTETYTIHAQLDKTTTLSLTRSGLREVKGSSWVKDQKEVTRGLGRTEMMGLLSSECLR